MLRYDFKLLKRDGGSSSEAEFEVAKSSTTYKDAYEGAALVHKARLNFFVNFYS